MELKVNVCVKLDKRKLKRVVNQARSFARKYQVRHRVVGFTFDFVNENSVIYCICNIVDDEGDVVADKKFSVITTTIIT